MSLDYLADDGICSSRVLAALRAVPRHRFVPPEHAAEAYANRPLPIGRGQTISQPYIVAYMTQELDVEPGSRVLEVGTGSGYQAAILAELGCEVFSVEIIAELAESARRVLGSLGYERVRISVGNGRDGWPGNAPYARIIVTAAAGQIPRPLLDQLEPGGRLIMPVGEPFGAQDLVMVSRSEAGRYSTRTLIPVRFVPLTGEMS